MRSKDMKLQNVLLFALGLFLCAALPMAAAEADPIFQIPFDESAGTTARDVSPAARELKIDPKFWTNGKSRGGYFLDGTEKSILKIPLTDSAAIGIKDFTMAGWICPGDQGYAALKDKRRRVFSIADDYPKVWAVVDILDGGFIKVEVGSKNEAGQNVGFSATAKTKVADGEWTHVAIVFARQEKRLYIYLNGTMDAEAGFSAAFNASLSGDRPFTIGSIWQNFIGSVDELRLHLRALSPSEVRELTKVFFSGTLKPVGAVKTFELKKRLERVAALTNYYVSTRGNDEWTGALAEPNAAKTDGPLATVAGAQAMIRAVKEKGGLPGPVTVTLRGGVYPISETLRFTAADSGTKAAPVKYRSQSGEEAVISGGKKVTGWKAAAGGLLEAEIPGVKAGDLYFHELYIGGTRAARTRLPKTGFYRIQDVVKDSKTEFFFKPGDIQNWKNLRDVNVTGYHAWTASLHWIDTVDLEANKVKFQNPSAYNFGQFGGKNERFYVENVREALTEPGEWYLDRKTGILTYYPKSGETAENLDAWYPVVDRILDFAGDPKNGAFVEWLVFQDLAFRHSDWGITPGASVKVDGQAHVSTRNAMVFAQGLANSRFENCEFSHGGVHAIWIEKGSSDNAVVHSHIHDFGGGGIYLGDTSYYDDPKLRSDRNIVDNSFLHRLNLILHGSHGIWIGKSSFNRITHNEICDLDYSPIAAGWTWGYATPSGVQGNIFEYNHLHHYGLGELSDMAGIYTLGISPGTVERFNIIHDGYSFFYGGWGLYTDEGSSDILLEKNLVYNTKSGGFHQHYGSNNLIQNNIFAFAAEQNIVSMRGDDKNKSFLFKKNIVLTTNGFPVNKGFKSEEFKIDENIYWDLYDNSLTNMSFAGSTWDEWRNKKGYDTRSFIADPGFADPLRGDFRLKSDAVVKKIGFVPFAEELAKTGLYGESAWKDLPKRYPPRPMNADIQPPAAKRGTGSRTFFAENFETIAPGVPSPFGKCDPGILVSTEEAFKGEHSLKFQDDASFDKEWKPHMSFENNFDPGILQASMDVFLEEGAIFWHEWREPGGSPYKVGPSLRFEANGDVVVGGKKIASVPRKKWIHIEITFENGSTTGSWDLALTVDGGTRNLFEGLRCGASNFESVETLIWSSMATIKTAFYLDNVRFKLDKK